MLLPFFPLGPRLGAWSGSSGRRPVGPALVSGPTLLFRPIFLRWPGLGAWSRSSGCGPVRLAPVSIARPSHEEGISRPSRGSGIPDSPGEPAAVPSGAELSGTELRSLGGSQEELAPEPSGAEPSTDLGGPGPSADLGGPGPSGAAFVLGGCFGTHVGGGRDCWAAAAGAISTSHCSIREP